ncbi:NAD(P)H-binding protein [Maribacter sp. MMG018]|uniref:NAD-dependent epimerase/dehydratase family protein n=1 Tax=Maribacter sp. MMG018 TaxID=2822688 RepID=UPI001B39BDDE|nr:NAD-dependent epimerase/dehydratase family protein [Maribacter sp. MMG018]MBQ4913702.1 NAD(P)H-binding protein [Maribacter sp. MMG018]
MIKRIGIIGCGWLGLPLAKNFIKEGFAVKGTTTSVDKLALLTNENITPYHIKISEKGIEGPIHDFLLDVDILIINIPPGLRGKGKKESYVKKMQFLVTELNKSSIKKVVFISSTAVYGDSQGEVHEKTTPLPSSESGRQLLQTENIFIGNDNFKTTIIRFGGLIGPDRHPINMLSGRQNLKNGNALINLIHLNDCIRLITGVLTENIWGTLLNGVYPDHPTKQQYYSHEALKRNIKQPEYQSFESKNPKKITSCHPFIAKKFTYLTPLQE